MRAPLVLVCALILFGAGCSSTKKPAYIPGQLLNDTQRRTLSDADREAAMQSYLQAHPLATSTPDIATQDTAAAQARTIAAHETPERVANFSGDAHHAQGMVRLFTHGQEKHLVLSDDFTVDAGLDLMIALSTSSAPITTHIADVTSLINIGTLTFSHGGQMYPLPTDLELNQIHSVVVYSSSFNVVFGTASFDE